MDSWKDLAYSLRVSNYFHISDPNPTEFVPIKINRLLGILKSGGRKRICPDLSACLGQDLVLFRD